MSTLIRNTEQLRVAVADGEADAARWDEFVKGVPDSTVSHLSGWKHIVEDVLGRDYIPLVAVTLDGEWRGVLPLVRTGGALVGRWLISMPYMNYGGPIGTAAAQLALLQAARSEALRSGAELLQIRRRTAPDTTDAARAPKVLVLLDLPEAAETLWSQLPSKVRSQIRRPMKEGMEFRTGIDQLEPFYAVFARNMRDLGTPVYPRRFFEELAATFPELTFGAVYHQGRPVGAGAGFTWRDEFEITWASCIRDYNSLSPNMLLYWSFMEEMIGRGIRVFNFGRSSPGTSTHRFKCQWRGRDVPLPWLEWSARERRVETSPSLAARGVSAAWQKLPLPLANRLGPSIARRLPWW